MKHVTPPMKRQTATLLMSFFKKNSTEITSMLCRCNVKRYSALVVHAPCPAWFVRGPFLKSPWAAFIYLFYFQSVKTHVELFVALLIEDQLWLLISEWQRNGKSEIDLQQVKCVYKFKTVNFRGGPTFFFFFFFHHHVLKLNTFLLILSPSVRSVPASLPRTSYKT